jgi:hypothetical protein
MEAAKVIKLHFGRLQEVSHARRELSANIPAGTSLETVLEPSYWAHYTRDLRPNDILEVVCEDGSWEASLRVRFVSTAEAKMAVRWKVEFDTDEVTEEESDTHFVKWISPPKKYGVIRRDTGAVIQDGFYPKAEAYNFLRKHLVKVAT